MFIPPALLLNGILVGAAKLAKAKFAAAGGSEGSVAGAGGWLDVAGELANVMFAHEANEKIIRLRERIAQRFERIHEPENVALERALAKSAITADILCLMAAMPPQAVKSGPLLSLARKLGAASDAAAGALSAGDRACIEQALALCNRRLQDLEAEYDARGIDAAALLHAPREQDSIELGRSALAAIEAELSPAQTRCGKLPDAAARIFERKWAGYLFGVFQQQRTKNDAVYKLFLELRLESGFGEVVGLEHEILGEIRKLTPQAPTGFYALESTGRFIGRDEELAEARRLWLNERERPLLIHGAAGIGKSTLARALLHEEAVVRQFGVRRFYIRSDEYASAELLLAAMGRRWFGLDSNPNIAQQVTAKLQEAPAAIAIDNFETPHATDRGPSEQLLSDLLGIPGLWMIAGVQGDELPGNLDWEPFRPKPLNLHFARKLFFDITHREAHLTDPLLDGLLNDMGGVPHAIELLSHQAADESLAELAGRWRDEGTALLARGEERRNNINAAYDFAIRSRGVNEAARRLLRILSHLPAGLAEEDVAKVTETVGNVSPQAAEAVLKRRALAFSGADRRLRMFAPLRFYVQAWAAREFAGSDETAPAIRHFVALGKSGEKVGGPGGGDVKRLLAVEYPNVEWAIGESMASNVAEAIEAALGAGEFARFAGVRADKLLESARVAAGRNGDVRGEANCIRRLGDIALARLNQGEARRQYEAAQALYREVGNVEGEANCIHRLGDIALVRSDHGEARRRYEAAQPLYEQVGALWGEANCILRLGDIALARSDQGEARRRYEAAQPLYQQVGDVLGEANCMKGLGDIALARSDYGEVRRRYEAAQPLYQQVGDVLGETNCIYSLGDIALALSDQGEARRRYEAAQPLYQQVGDVLGEANCITGLGDIALARSDHGEARRRYEAAQPLYQQVGDVLGEANCILRLGDIERARSDYGEARRRYEAAQPLYRQVGSVLGEANCMQGLADIERMLSNFEDSRWQYLQALDLFERIQDAYSIGGMHLQLARLTSGEERSQHVASMREAWLSIDRPDLVEKFSAEFGDSI